MQARKTVTILFCDVADSTPLGEQLDPESLQRVMGRWFTEARAVIERHGGTVEKFIGDEVMAVFGVPHVHEDDALRGVRAASELLDQLATLNDELEQSFGVRLAVRIGVNTGEVVVGDPSGGGTFVTGAAVNLAKRLEQAAAPGQILIGRATYPLVRDAVQAGPLQTFPVKGKREPVSTWSVDRVQAGARGVARRTETPLVGRQAELARLRAAHDAVAATRACRLVTLLGPAGIGKSRLAEELASAVAPRTRVLAGRCLPYGDGITFWALAEIVGALDAGDALETALQDADDRKLVLERLRALGGAAPAAVDDVFWAARRLFESLAAEQPLLVVLEDVHWAEPTLLDLVEYLHGWISCGHVLLLCVARPDLLDRRPGWATPRERTETIALQPLPVADSEQLLAGLGADLTESERERVLASAEGNPLYVEQLAALAATGEVVVPPTIAALLAERLDRLDADERAILQRAAVVGREFGRRTVTDLCPPELRPDVGRVLLGLARKELIQAQPGASREDRFRFRHGLIRDAAYDGTPKEARALFHEWLADWLERHAMAEAAPDELVGYHLEQAYRLRLELAPADDRSARLARRAAQRLGAAGRRAFAREDLPAGLSLLDRAVAHAPPELPELPELLLDLSAALWSTGEIDRADELLASVVEAAEATGSEALQRHGLLEQTVRAQARGRAGLDAVQTAAEQARAAFTRLGEELGLARAGRRLAWVHVARCEFEAAAGAAEQALAHARRAGDPREETRIADVLCTALLWGPTPAAVALERCETMLAERASRPLEAHVGVACCGLLAMLSRHGEARERAAQARRLYEELGLRFAIAGLCQVAGEAELAAGAADAAERLLREAAEILEAYGESPLTQALLAHALLAQRRLDDAERAAREAAAADPHEAAALVHAATALARIALQRGDEESASAEGRRALEVARGTDAPVLRAEAGLVQAEVWAASGHSTDAAEARDEARRLLASKGHVAALRALEAAATVP